MGCVAWELGPEDSAMASKRSKPTPNGRTTHAQTLSPQRDAGSPHRHRTWSHLFSEFACRTAHFAGHPLAFTIAVLMVVAWALTGPAFNYSDTWQLVINT